MDPQQERDEWLMAQVSLGRRDHLEPLVRRYAQPLLSFIARMVGDTHQAEELFQEVFLVVWKKRKQYRFPLLFRPWLYKIALNKCRAMLRSGSSAKLASYEESVRPSEDDSLDTPSSAAAAMETASLVSAAVVELPPKQCSVVVLRIWNDLSYDEIAQVLGTSTSTVRSHMHHGLAGLRKSLQPHLEPSG